MASYVFMKVLESSPRRYDRGISILSLGQISRTRQDITKSYISGGDKILEIGCGSGTLAIACAEKGALVVGFDISPPMLSLARQKIKKRNLSSKIKLHEMSATEMDKVFANQSFNKIVSTLTFSEFYTDEQKHVLREAYRILKPGGLIIIADEVKPNVLWKRILHQLIRLPLVVITYILTQTSTKAVKDIKSLLNEAGFEVIEEKRSFLDSFGLYVAKKPA